MDDAVKFANLCNENSALRYMNEELKKQVAQYASNAQNRGGGGVGKGGVTAGTSPTRMGNPRAQAETPPSNAQDMKAQLRMERQGSMGSMNGER